MSDHRRWRILIDENGREWGTTHDSAANEGEELIEVVPAAELDAAIEDKGSGWDSYISRRYKELLEELRLVSEQRDAIADGWHRHVERISLAVDELDCMLDVHDGDQAMPDVHVARTKLREILGLHPGHISIDQIARLATISPLSRFSGYWAGSEHGEWCSRPDSTEIDVVPELDYHQLRFAAEGVLRQLDNSSTVDPWAIERLRDALDTNAAPPGQELPHD